MAKRNWVGSNGLIANLAAALFSFSMLAQDVPVDSVVKDIMMRGIEYAERGQFDLALIEYSKAREIVPKDGFVNYETALAHYELHNNDRALAYAKKASKEASEHGLQAYILLGTVYDEQGRYRKSVRAFEKGIKRFGNYYLLHYNLGVTALDHRDYERANDAFQMALYNKLDHLDSQFALAKVKAAQSRKSEALYPLYFYLLLAPEDTMANAINSSIDKVRNLGIKFSKSKDEDESEQQQGGVYVYDSGDGMFKADLKLSTLEAINSLESYGSKSSFDAELDLLQSYFLFVNQLDFGNRDDLYTEYYVPFFAAIAGSKHLKTFLHYIKQSSSEESAKWVNANFEKLESFFEWLDQEAPKIPATGNNENTTNEIGLEDK